MTEREKTETEDRFRMTLRLDPQLHDRLKVAAKRDRRTLTSLIDKILSDWVDQHGEQS